MAANISSGVKFSKGRHMKLTLFLADFFFQTCMLRGSWTEKDELLRIPRRRLWTLQNINALAWLNFGRGKGGSFTNGNGGTHFQISLRKPIMLQMPVVVLTDVFACVLSIVEHFHFWLMFYGFISEAATLKSG